MRPDARIKKSPTVLTGAKPLLETGNREVVTVLREITVGKVREALCAATDLCTNFLQRWKDLKS